jgi:hypothetical protein
MNITNIFKGQKRQVIPTLVLILFPVLVELDSVTTYLGSPELEFEDNPLISYFFHWGWKGLFLFDCCYIGITIFLVIVLNKYIMKYYIAQKKILFKDKFLFYLSCLFVFIFYSHFIGHFWASINNYLTNLYTFSKQENPFYSIASDYVTFYNQYSDKKFMVEVLFFAFGGILFSLYRLNRVKKYATQNFQ